jgi:hypothetical protein
MIDGAYLLLLLAIVWMALQLPNPWLSRLEVRRQQTVRTVAMIPAVLLAVLGVIIVGLQVGGEAPHSALSWLIAAMTLAGSLLYGLGVLAWNGRPAFLLRVIGWVMLVVALVIPSTATLALPLVALLVPTLAVVRTEGIQGRSGVGVPNSPPR